VPALRITFHGAARQVTGSAHLLEVGQRRILLDCGLFDTDRLSPDSPNRNLTIDPATIDAVVVSHGHNDHIGRLPCLTRAGYRGPIYATPATADIMNVMLRDSARIQREDARKAAALIYASGNAPAPVPAIEPLFELHDVEWVVDLTQRLPFDDPFELFEGITLTYRPAGHILGAAIVQLDCQESGQTRRIVFTGDLGRRDMGLLPDPSAVKGIDVLITESTYGGRELETRETLMKQLHAIIARATRLRSKVVIPAFSLGRTQRIAYCLQELFDVRKVKPIPIYVDSPLAARITEIHRDHPELYTKAARRLMRRDPEFFGSPHITYCRSFDDSRRLNELDGPLVIIASSGMCDAGRIRHHLRHTVEDPDNAVVIVSYQAEGTLGRYIAEGAEQIRIMDQAYDLNAAVYVLDGFSGHADRNDLRSWFEETGGNISSAFIVHGEPDQMESLRPLLEEFVTGQVHIPERLQSFEI
jgi:metallo-beta-lactamase family protein